MKTAENDVTQIESKKIQNARCPVSGSFVSLKYRS